MTLRPGHQLGGTRALMKQEGGKALCEIVTEIRRMLDSRQPALIYNNQENVFALQQNGVMMEMEVCQVPGLPALNGLKLRKIAGDTGQYKELCQDMLKAINL